MWQDMKLYWAWRGGPIGYCEAPTKKKIFRRADGYAELAATYTAVARACIDRVAL